LFIVLILTIFSNTNRKPNSPLFLDSPHCNNAGMHYFTIMSCRNKDFYSYFWGIFTSGLRSGFSHMSAITLDDMLHNTSSPAFPATAARLFLPALPSP